MSEWLTLQAAQVDPQLVGEDAEPAPVQWFKLRAHRDEGAMPDSTQITIEWDDGEVHTQQWLLSNEEMRATRLPSPLHVFADIGPAKGKVHVGLSRMGGLVANLEYPTLAGLYQLPLR